MYKVLDDTFILKLEEQVVKHQAMGWKVTGGVFITQCVEPQTGDVYNRFYQAIVTEGNQDIHNSCEG